MSVKMLNMEFGITKQNVIQATKNYVYSEQYLEMMVKVSVLNILYHRLPVPDIFYSKEFESIPYQAVKTEYAEAPIIKLYRKWIRGFKDAFRKKYLEELVLFFYNEETKEIEENYVFKFYYEENINVANACTDLTEPTENLLKVLISLGDFPKLDGSSLSLHVEMFYAPDTPIKYKPENFVEKDFCNTLKYKMNSTLFDKPATFARICSKFHYFKGTYCRKRPISQLSQESESEVLVKPSNEEKKVLSQTSTENNTVKKPKIKNQSKPVTPCAHEVKDKKNYIEKKMLDMEFDIFETAECEAETSMEKNNETCQLSDEPESYPLVKTKKKNRLSQCSVKTDNVKNLKNKKSTHRSKPVTPSVSEDEDKENYIYRKIHNMETEISDVDRNEAVTSVWEIQENSQCTIERQLRSMFSPTNENKNSQGLTQTSSKKSVKSSKIKKAQNNSEPVTPCASEDEDKQNYIAEKMIDIELDTFNTARSEAGTSVAGNDNSEFLGEPELQSMMIPFDNREHRSQTLAEIDAAINFKISKICSQSDAPDLNNDGNEQNPNRNVFDTDIDIFETAPSEQSHSVSVDISYSHDGFPNDEDINLIVATVNSSKDGKILEVE